MHGGTKLISPTSLVEVERFQFKKWVALYELSSVRRGLERKKHTHARSLALPHRAWRGVVKGPGARHAREWSDEIRSQALQTHYFLLQFVFATCPIP
jgi:hypothetical protein